MRAVLVHASDSILEERRRLGIDKQDERWDGEWHLVNPPKRWHARLNAQLFLLVAPRAEGRGLVPYADATGIFSETELNWRVPDQAYARPEHEIDEGLSGAALVVEIRSPGDESYEKLPFYAERGVDEVLVVNEDRRAELFRRGDDGTYVIVRDGAGSSTSAVLGVRFATVEGPRLRVAWEGGSAEV